MKKGNLEEEPGTEELDAQHYAPCTLNCMYVCFIACYYEVLMLIYMNCNINIYCNCINICQHWYLWMNFDEYKQHIWQAKCFLVLCSDTLKELAVPSDSRLYPSMEGWWKNVAFCYNMIFTFTSETELILI